jgi:hypothetical protein
MSVATFVPAPGWTTTPAGLSTTRRWASSCTTTTSSSGAGRTSTASGTATSSTSTSSPGLGSRAAVHADPSEHEQRGADHDRGIRQVEDGPPLQIDEVDDATAQEAVAGAEHPIGEVADRTTEHEPEADSRHGAMRAGAAAQQDDDDGQDDQ